MTKYGERSYQIGTRWFPDSEEAQAALDWLVALYEVPQPILTISIHGNRDANHLSETLRRKVSDRITIVATNSTELGISGDFFIESEHHIIDAHLQHQVTWECSPTTTLSPFWIMNTGVLGTTTALHY